MNSGIYKIVNLINNFYYIGSSEELSNRKKRHWQELRSNIHPNNKLQNSWNKYGEKNFEFQILLLCDKEDLVCNEQMFIDFSPLNEMFNIRLKANCTRGKSTKEETKIKISNSLKGRVVTDETKERISRAKKGRKNSEEHKRKVSEALKGKPINENARKNLRTPEAIEKARQKKLGRPLSEKHKEKLKIAFSKKEYREKRSIQMTGKKHSDEAKKKMSDFQKERNKLDRENGTVKTNSEETRQKIRDSLNTPEMKALLKQRWVERKKKQQQQQKEENKENAD